MRTSLVSGRQIAQVIGGPFPHPVAPDKDETMVEKSDFERASERSTGEDIDYLRNTSVEDKRRKLEKKFGRPMRFVSRWPLIGRGSIIRKTVSHEEVERRLRKAWPT